MYKEVRNLTFGGAPSMTQKTLVETACGDLVLVTLALVAAGCAPAKAPQAKPATTVAHDHDHDHGKKNEHADHDHDHDHGEHAAHDTLAGALAELEKICASVKKELDAKNLDEADGHVHMVGHLVDDMHRLVGSAKLSEDAKAAATKALDEIFDAFDKLDTALHSADEKVKEAIDYLEHEPRVQAALGELKKAAAAVETGIAKVAETVEAAAESVKDAVEEADAKE
jgi:hypothetical protein